MITEGFKAWRIPDDKRDNYFEIIDSLQDVVGAKLEIDGYSDPIIKFKDISIMSKVNQDYLIHSMNAIGAKDISEIYN